MGRDVPPSRSATLPDLIRDRAESHPAAPALLAPGRDPLTFAGLARQIDGFSAYLNSRGLGRGDRVAVLAELGPEAAAAILGVSAAAVSVPLAAASIELEQALVETRATALLAVAPATSEVRRVADRLRLPLLEGFAPAGAEAGRIELSGGRPGRATRSGRARAGDLAVLLRTSGSTRRPKLVPSEHRHLVARAAKTARLLNLGPADRCLCPMPLCYAHGLQSGVFAPLASGGSTILPASFEADDFLDCLGELSPSWYSAGATHQRAILGWLHGRGVPKHRLRFARSGSDALGAGTARDLKAVLGVPIVEAYSTSETGMIVASPPDGARRSGSVGIPHDGEVAVVDDRGDRVAAGAEGEIVVRGPTVFSGYEDGANARASFRGDWFRTGDLGVVDADGYLAIRGRLDDVINRGGEKVSPAEVEAVLRQHPDVANVVVFPVPHATLGQEVGAAVTLRLAGAADEATLRAFALTRLARARAPRRIVIADALPVSPSGKLRRRGLAEQFRLGPHAEPATGAASAVRNPLERALVGLWRDALEHDDASPEDDFFELGGDSLSALELLAAAEAELGVRLRPEALFELPTPRLLSGGLEDATERRRLLSDPDRDVIALHADGANPPLFALGGRGGSTFGVLTVCRELGPEQPVYGLEPPRSGSPRPPTVADLAAHCRDRIRALQPHGPYRLLGTSFGGLVAFETAIGLERAGAEVEFLCLVDTYPATVSLGRDTDAAPTPGPDDIEMPAIRSPAGREVEAAIEADLRARAGYVIDHRVGADLTYLYCADEGTPGDRRRLWQRATTGDFRLLGLPGRHGSFDREPQHSALAGALRACLDGSEPPPLDPTQAFDRGYALELTEDGELVRDPDRVGFRVTPGEPIGRVRVVKPALGRLIVRGWASEPDGQSPAETLVTFVDGSYAGHTTCGLATERLAQRRSAPGLRRAGFRARVALPASWPGPAVRVFALSADGRARELHSKHQRSPGDQRFHSTGPARRT